MKVKWFWMWIGGAIGRVAGTGLVFGFFFVLDGATPGQAIPGEAEDNWQVPYDEHFLNSEGTTILNPDYPDEIPRSVDLRVAFYFHYLDLSRPIKTPFGDMSLPEVTKKPGRLSILEYDPPD